MAGERGEPPQTANAGAAGGTPDRGVQDVASANTLRAERDAHQREMRNLARFPDENPWPVLRVDRQGVLLYANRSSADLRAHWAWEVGQKIPDCLGPALGRALDSGQQVEQEITVGSRTYVLVFNPIVAEGYVNVYGRDVTERNRIQQELLAAKEVAEAGNHAKGEFLATMSHEIRTPLNGVLGMLQLAQATRLDPEQKLLVDTALDSGRHLLRILSDILDISRIEANTLLLEEEEFDIVSVVQPVIGSFIDEATRQGLRLQNLIAPDVPARLVGDPGRVRQVLFNLVGNALKYTETGEVRLEVYPLSIEKGPDRKLIHFAVIDTGIGIREDNLKRVLDLFTQVEGKYSRTRGGTGLGLAIVRRLVERMGGTLSICSELGAFTEVHVTLLLGLPAAGSAAESVAVAGGPLWMDVRGMKILIVEDDRVNRLTARRFLEKLGCQASEVANGREALEELEKNSYDGVLMDVEMPEMNGLEATMMIRSGRSEFIDPKLPIIAMTAHAMKDDREAIIMAGMDEYISKPVDLDVLEKVLATVLARRDSREQEVLDAWVAEATQAAPDGECASRKKVSMSMRELRNIARQYGANLGEFTKIEAIRLIQKAEGNFDCFARAHDGYCNQQACIFMQDCLKYAAATRADAANHAG